MLAHAIEGLDDGGTPRQIEAEHDGDGAIEPEEEAIFVGEEAVQLLAKPGRQLNNIKVGLWPEGQIEKDARYAANSKSIQERA